jgi:diguanylate cyclase
MQRQLDSAEEKLKTQAQQIESHAVEARTDALTQVANRRALDDEVARCVADFARRGMPSTVMLLDVDHFKKFNDAHGHQAGDDALKAVARALSTSIGDVGLVARYGGEEFAVVLAGLSSAAAIPYCERARQAIGLTIIRVGSRDLRVTSSAGVAEVQGGDCETDLLGRADEALYASKKAGRNCGHFNDGQKHTRLKLNDPAQPLPAQSTAGKTGDEWLFDGEESAQAMFGESIANVANRPAFFDDLIRRLSQWKRGGAPLTVLMIQVDHFDQIVTDYGSGPGDIVLRIAAQLINAVMRDMDQVTRISEDTFAILLPGALLSDGVTIAERLRQTVERCRLPRKAGTSWFTISVGVIEASDGDDLRRILERGRHALSAAIHQGRNCVVGRDSLGSQVRNDQPAVAAP